MVGGLDWETAGKWAELREEMAFGRPLFEKIEAQHFGGTRRRELWQSNAVWRVKWIG